MASNPPGECCASGVLHEGVPKGNVVDFGGVETYITRPNLSTDDSKVIYFLTDIAGHKSINAQLLADSFATHGYTVVVPDLFFGDAAVFPPMDRPEEWTLEGWLKKHQPEDVQPVVDKVLANILSELKPQKLFAIGYCFGAKYVFRLLSTQTPSLTAGFVAHPSFTTLPEVQAITHPISIAAAETDSIFPVEKRYTTEEALRNSKVGVAWELFLYGGVAHGFAVRGDWNVRAERWGMERAFWQAVGWFGEWSR